MDFQGQKQAEQLIYRVLTLFALAGFLAGYALGSFALMVYINAAGLALTLLLVVPDWPLFNRHPLNWLPPLNPDEGGGGAASSGSGGAVAPAGGGGTAAAAASSGRGRLTKR